MLILGDPNIRTITDYLSGQLNTRSIQAVELFLKKFFIQF